MGHGLGSLANHMYLFEYVSEPKQHLNKNVMLVLPIFIRASLGLAEKVWKVSQSTMIARDRNLIFCYFPNLHFSALLNGGWSHNSGTIIFCIAELNSEIGVKVIRQIHLV